MTVCFFLSYHARQYQINVTETSSAGSYNNGGDADIGSVTVAVDCKAGGRVWVENSWNGGFTYEGLANSGAYHTTFTAALLQQIF